MSSTIPSIILAANELNYVAMMYIRCYCYVVIPLGLIGHSLSIYVFTRPKLRTNPCGIYFLAATIVGLLDTCYLLPIRMVQTGFVDTDPGAYSVIVCKITWFITNIVRGLSFWLIVLACADRYLCSCASTRMRSWSDVHVARRVILLTTLLGIIAYIHVPIFYRIDIIPTTQKPICYPPGPPGPYRVFLAYFQLAYFGLTPPLCMLIFGLLTLRNLERSRRLIVAPLTNVQTQNTRKTNRHMLRMLFVQVSMYSITGLTFSIGTIITSIRASQPETVFQIAQDSVINTFVGMTSNTGPCLSFYLFTLSSGLFRKELENLFCRFNRNANQPPPILT